MAKREIWDSLRNKEKHIDIVKNFITISNRKREKTMKSSSVVTNKLTPEEIYIKKLESEVDKRQNANNSIRDFIDYIVDHVHTQQDMIERICNKVLDVSMILNWLESTPYWSFDSKVADGNFERRIYTSTKKSGNDEKRISVITKVNKTNAAERKILEQEQLVNVYEALKQILGHAEAHNISEIRIVTDIILCK